MNISQLFVYKYDVLKRFFQTLLIIKFSDIHLWSLGCFLNKFNDICYVVI